MWYIGGGGATATNSNKSKAIRLNHTEQMVAAHQKVEGIDVKNVHVNSDIGSCNDGLIVQTLCEFGPTQIAFFGRLYFGPSLLGAGPSNFNTHYRLTKGW